MRLCLNSCSKNTSPNSNTFSTMLENKEKKAVLDHVFHKVLGLTDTDPLVQAIKLDGITDILDVVTFSDKDLEYLQYITDDGFKMTIPTWYQDYTNIFIEYVYYRHNTTAPLHNNWLSLTNNIFYLRINNYFP